MLDEIDALTRASREERDPVRERRLVKLRHLAGVRLVEEAATDPDFAAPAFDALPDGPLPPEVDQGGLTAGLLRAAILRHGCLLVRGLLDRQAALDIAADIDQAFEAREMRSSGGSASEAYYKQLTPDPPYPPVTERGWIEVGGGLLACDSPKLMFDMVEALHRAGFIDVVEDYLGEPPALSAQKATLRRAEPNVAGAWHQDGKFLGKVRSLNLWLSLSRCGDEAPGLDIVPRRIDHLVEAGEEGTLVEIQVTDETVKKVAGEVGVLRPIFEPGDALLFDELFLHQTGSDPAMPKPRYAIESWFFGPSAFPGEYHPLAT